MNAQLIDALNIVLSLASANALDMEDDDPELQDEADKQRGAIELIDGWLNDHNPDGSPKYKDPALPFLFAEMKGCLEDILEADGNLDAMNFGRYRAALEAADKGQDPALEWEYNEAPNDFRLREDHVSCWVLVGDISLYIRSDNDVVIVEAYPHKMEDNDDAMLSDFMVYQQDARNLLEEDANR